MAKRIWRGGSGLKPTDDWRTFYTELWKPMATQPHDGMTLTQFTTARDALRGALAAFDKVSPDCRSCTHFELGECKKHGPIPAEFQRQPEACPEWAYDGIPF